MFGTQFLQSSLEFCVMTQMHILRNKNETKYIKNALMGIKITKLPELLASFDSACVT